MPLTLQTDSASFDVSRAVLRMPRKGAWQADVTLVTSAALTEGLPVLLTLGDVALRGTLLPGGDFGETGYWTVIGGAGGWARQVATLAYTDPSGVLLSRAVKDLAASAKEPEPILDVDDAPIGTRWTRLGATATVLASEALDALTDGAWYVAADGVTHVGAPPLRALNAPPELTVKAYDPSRHMGTIQIADEAFAVLLPGCVLTAPGLPGPLTINSIRAEVSEGSYTIEAFGEKGTAELLRDLIESLTAYTRYHALAPVTVATVSGSTASVQGANGDARAAGVPGSPLLPQAYGVPGVSAVLQAGAQVLMVWPGGDPSSPTIALYLPGSLPVSLNIDATTEIRAGGTSTLATAVATAANLNALRLGIIAAGGPNVSLVPIATTKLKGG